ncbi:Translocation protein SEC62 [Tupaia chinensis]|uniref:Translocation protein SEC62 n=1 Tax=Tupaia chinensis TaxID=246437 RepID=L9KHN8_TUPCH|nr:Translocation protein SEC62 [Tupaia chinensis]
MAERRRHKKRIQEVGEPSKEEKAVAKLLSKAAAGSGEATRACAPGRKAVGSSESVANPRKALQQGGPWPATRAGTQVARNNAASTAGLRLPAYSAPLAEPSGSARTAPAGLTAGYPLGPPSCYRSSSDGPLYSDCLGLGAVTGKQPPKFNSVDQRQPIGCAGFGHVIVAGRYSRGSLVSMVFAAR